IDDDEHFSSKVAGSSVEHDAGHFDLIQQSRIALAVKVQTGQTMLTINDEKPGLGVLKVANRFELSQRPKFQDFFGENKNGAGYSRLDFRGLVEIHDVADLAPAQQTLKRLLAAFHAADKLRDRIVLVGSSFDGFPFKVESAGEARSLE